MLDVSAQRFLQSNNETKKFHSSKSQQRRRLLFTIYWRISSFSVERRNKAVPVGTVDGLYLNFTVEISGIANKTIRQGAICDGCHCAICARDSIQTKRMGLNFPIKMIRITCGVHQEHS